MEDHVDTQDRTQLAAVGWPDAVGTARRRGFRIMSGLFALFALAYFGFGFLELVLMWFPGETLNEMFGEDFSEIHRSHFMAVGVVSWAMVLSVFAQLRKPWKRVGSMTLVVAAALAGTVLYGLSGTLGEWLIEEVILLGIVAIVAGLHPRRGDVFSLPSFHRGQGLLTAVAAVPWAVYLVDNAWNQWTNLAGDTHAEMEHWATAALMAFVIVVAAAIGSSDHDGRHLPAWIAVGGSILFGAHSLVFGGLASGLPMLWAVAAIAWGITYAFLTVMRTTTEDPAIDRAEARA